MSGMTVDQIQKDLDTHLSHSISITLELLSDIILQINSLETCLPQKEYHWNLRLSDLTNDISKFVEITNLLSKTMYIKKKILIPEIKESHVHLLFVLKGINQAHQKMDTLILEDLIKYELKDNLTQWKINLIPLIKRHLNP